MLLKTIDSKDFSRFGRHINLEENFQFLKDFSYEEKSWENSKKSYICATPVYIEKLSGQAILSCAVNDDTSDEAFFIFDSPLKLNANVKFSFMPLTDDFLYCIYYSSNIKLAKKESQFRESGEKEIHCSNIIYSAKKHLKNGIVFRPESQPYWELNCLRKGNVTRLIKNEIFNVSGGYISFIPPDAVHSSISEKENIEMWVVMFDMDLDEPERLMKPIRVTSTIDEYLNRIFELSENSTKYSESIILHLLSLIVLECLEAIDDRKDDSNDMRISARMGSIVKAAEEIIVKNIFNSYLSVDYIAESLSISKSYLYKCFTSEKNTGVSGYIQDVKLNIAKKLLVEDEYSILAVSNDLNFCSQSYFSAQFKKKFGISPLQYKRLFSNENRMSMMNLQSRNKEEKHLRVFE